MRTVRMLGAGLVAAATAIVLVALAIAPFLSPAWIAFAQDRAEADRWTGLTRPEVRTVTEAIVADLVVGPPAFDVTIRGEPVLGERERAHMRDVRAVLVGFAATAAVALAGLLATWLVTRGGAAFWAAVRLGASVVAGAVVALGALVVVAFDLAFELFHRVFFPPGTYTFDPRTERLVQLFPERFWVETSVGIGLVLLGLALAVRALAGRRAAVARGVDATVPLAAPGAAGR
ncbi:MAG TPA: DUF1461 domain-containing protein [Candidatus Limnocylindrales bacterium]|nr:DUF1461 domain-containing protein [Candidatus Limnocylindrales bacterium]